MKKFLLSSGTLVSLILSCHLVKAQYVSIPDSNFRKFLFANYPTAMMGTQMDTTNWYVINTPVITCDSLKIRSLEGIQYFDNLKTLDCSYNLIRTFTALPPFLINFDCHTNQLDSLPELPQFLSTLNCKNNNMVRLPDLPVSLTQLNCSINKLDSLSDLNNIIELDCGFNQLDSLPSLPVSLTNLYCNNNMIVQLPVLPNGLTGLNCSSNSVGILPALPATLISLSCAANLLTTIPVLPSGLEYLSCGQNSVSALPVLPSTLLTLLCDVNLLSNLPVLPTGLQILNCRQNSITTLPLLPSVLNTLDCGYNLIPSLPALPGTLQFLDYSANPITSLPLLPSSLTQLIWNSNATPVLPALPASLLSLICDSSMIDSLPTLPAGLTSLRCEFDSLTFLPALPSGLKHLNFSHNFLSVMPTIPLTLESFLFADNLISSLPYIPSTVKNFDCSSNIGLSCLPKIPTPLYSIYISNTSITCLPNYFDMKYQGEFYPMNLNLPLCTVASGCPVEWNITGNVHSDTSANCLLDSLLPGNRSTYVKVNMFKNALFQNSIYLTSQGEYSFNTSDNDTLDISVDTVNMPFKVICPVTISKQVIVTPADSLKTNVNFGIECNGIDAGVQSIMSKFRPGEIAHINIQAGNMAQFYHVNCPFMYSATVTTILEGPVQYLMPSASALTPNSVSGNVLTYYIPDMSLIDGYTAFGVDVITDTSAVMGSEVCITTRVTNVVGDVRPSNDVLQICIPVVSSFDPNIKMVSPSENAKAGDVLTYTICFQNTGTDTARKVVVKDTLSSNLIWSSFQFLASSHQVEIDQQQNVLTFYFNQINLVDSLHNEPLSHGWVQFKIALKDNLAMGTRTDNLASIYFDFNAPIVTDTAKSFIGPQITPAAIANPVKFPTAITPNRDGLNDSWHILNANYLQQKNLTIQQVIVRNRWGQKVFASSGFNFVWEAYGINSTDVFTYDIIYSTLSGNTYTQRGEIIVVK